MIRRLSHVGQQLRSNVALSVLVLGVTLGVGLSVITSAAPHRSDAAWASDVSTRSSALVLSPDRLPTGARKPQALRSNSTGTNHFSADRVVLNVGCARSTSAQGLHDFFAEALGPIIGHDEPRITPLGDGRTLWILQDTFIDYHYSSNGFADMDYANNTVLIQNGLCFTMLQGGTPSHAESFELGDAPMNHDRYFWAGGATVSGGRLYVFWLEFVRDTIAMGPLDGFGLHPVRTWLATYDPKTFKRLDFRLAPNSGVSPVYGYGVGDDGDWTYLFGNSDLQNLALEGGYSNGPHSATRIYLARVPRGQVGSTPTYWTGASWSTDPAAAVPISSRFFVENMMLPVLIDGHWYSATKVDGFTGTNFVVDEADHPWGPYTTIRSLPAVPRGDPTDVLTYHAAVLPWLDPSGGLIITMSQIPADMGAPTAEARYRPNFFVVQP